MGIKRSRTPARIAVDFDGTLATKSWPGPDSATRLNGYLARWLARRRKMGDSVVLWTCRENFGGVNYPDDSYLDRALEYCRKHGIEFDGVNCNAGEQPGDYERRMYSRKVSADAYIDDRGLPFDPEGPLAGLWWRLFLFLLDRRLRRQGM